MALKHGPCIKGGAQGKGIRKQDPQVNIWEKYDENAQWRMLRNEKLLPYT